MKQLLFTFFAVVLCYSLFFDNEDKPATVDGLNYIYEETSPDVYPVKDTLNPYVYNVVKINDNAAGKSAEIAGSSVITFSPFVVMRE
ncbi:MAG: hypothetical protein LBL33_09465 [Tannerella sp.]|jgi:hypothetical protein|nr:hypothetical protein [Tannerella sp.]